jgi:lysophospholipid acyltransferase (LPLAT)-like uncharacterized protein
LSAEFGFKDKLLLLIAELLGPFIIRLLGLTCRYNVEGMHHMLEAEKNGGVIIALWHGRMLLPVYHLRNRGITSLVSLHRDGEFIARIVKHLGYIPRRGSPKEGGREGFNAMVRDLREGRTVAIFPDGPTGPRYSVRDGVMQLARLTGAPILPISYSAKLAWRFKSWDRYMVMKPLSRGILIMGEPFTIPRRFESDNDRDRYRDLIRGQLIQVEMECDRRMGVVEFDDRENLP